MLPRLFICAIGRGTNRGFRAASTTAPIRSPKCGRAPNGHRLMGRFRPSVTLDSLGSQAPTASIVPAGIVAFLLSGPRPQQALRCFPVPQFLRQAEHQQRQTQRREIHRTTRLQFPIPCLLDRRPRLSQGGILNHTGGPVQREIVECVRNRGRCRRGRQRPDPTVQTSGHRDAGELQPADPGLCQVDQSK